MLIKWDETCRVGVERFDDQHKKLFEMMNALVECVGEENSDRNPEIGEVLDSLFQYTASHFTEEEQMLSRHGYPEVEAQIREHDFLTAKVKELHRNFYSGKAPLTLDVITFMQDWLLDHIKVNDTKYRKFLNDKGVK